MCRLYVFPFWVGVENRLYDFFLGLKSDVKEDSSIVLLDIDDISIEKVGLYPWPRNTIAQGMEALTQLGAEFAVFDIEYIDKSPMSVDFAYLNGALKAEFAASFEEIGANVNVSIPLDSKGRMLIRWPKKTYQNSFTHIPFYLLIDYAASGEKTATQLRLLRANQG